MQRTIEGMPVDGQPFNSLTSIFYDTPPLSPSPVTSLSLTFTPPPLPSTREQDTIFSALMLRRLARLSRLGRTRNHMHKLEAATAGDPRAERVRRLRSRLLGEEETTTSTSSGSSNSNGSESHHHHHHHKMIAPFFSRSSASPSTSANAAAAHFGLQREKTDAAIKGLPRGRRIASLDVMFVPLERGVPRTATAASHQVRVWPVNVFREATPLASF